MSRRPPAAEAGQLLADDDAVVELDRSVPDLLDRLVTLAGDDDDVPGARGLERGRDRAVAGQARPGAGRPRRSPARTSAMIANGSSLRGLSEVSTARSARRVAIAPIKGRLARSRSPPQPKTTITRPPRARPQRARREDLLDSLRGVGVVDHDRGTDAVGHRFQPPGGPVAAERPAAMVAVGTPSARAAPAAARAFATFISPPGRTVTGSPSKLK